MVDSDIGKISQKRWTLVYYFWKLYLVGSWALICLICLLYVFVFAHLVEQNTASLEILTWCKFILSICIMIGCSHRAIILFFTILVFWSPTWQEKIGYYCETRCSLPNCNWLTVIEQEGLPPSDHLKECSFTYIFFTYLKTAFGALSESSVIQQSHRSEIVGVFFTGCLFSIISRLSFHSITYSFCMEWRDSLSLRKPRLQCNHTFYPLLKIMDYSLEAVGVGLPCFPIVKPMRILLDHRILTK